MGGTVHSDDRKCAFFVKFLFLFLPKIDIISFDC